VLRPRDVVLFLHGAVGRVCSRLYEGILHDCLRCPRIRADPANVLVVCVTDKLMPVVLVEGQESRIPTVYGYMVQLREPDDGVKSVAGSPILVPVARDVPVLSQVLKYFQFCSYPPTSAILLVASVEAPRAPIVEHHADFERVCPPGGAKGVLARLKPVQVFLLS
jgi:hypothetical protein